jgi:hypothetical protein
MLTALKDLYYISIHITNSSTVQCWTGVNTKNAVFWVETLCSTETAQHSGGTQCLHLWALPKLHGITTQKTVPFTTIAVRISKQTKLTWQWYLYIQLSSTEHQLESCQKIILTRTCWHSWVRIVTQLQAGWPENRGSISSGGRDLSPHHCIQTSSGTC